MTNKKQKIRIRIPLALLQIIESTQKNGQTLSQRIEEILRTAFDMRPFKN